MGERIWELDRKLLEGFGWRMDLVGCKNEFFVNEYRVGNGCGLVDLDLGCGKVCG
jgi:hypothetical protein